MIDFSNKNTKKEGVLFYLKNLLAVFALVLIINQIVNRIAPAIDVKSIDLGLYTLYTIAILFLIYRSKKFKNIRYYVLGILAILFSITGGFFFSLIIPAYFTTLENNK